MMAGYKELEIYSLNLPFCIRIINAYTKHMCLQEHHLRVATGFIAKNGKIFKQWKIATDEINNEKNEKLDVDTLKKLYEKINKDGGN